MRSLFSTCNLLLEGNWSDLHSVISPLGGASVEPSNDALPHYMKIFTVIPILMHFLLLSLIVVPTESDSEVIFCLQLLSKI